MAEYIDIRQEVSGILKELEACAGPLSLQQIENIILQHKNMWMMQQVDIANGGEFCEFMDNLILCVKQACSNGPLTKQQLVELFKNVKG